MILQDDGNARRERSERQHLRMKAEAMHVTDIRGEGAQQFAQGVTAACRRCAAEGQKEIVDAFFYQALRMRACLHHRDAATGLANCVGDVNERRPRDEQLLRQAAGGIIEEADLSNFQRGARHDRYRLMTRGSQWRTSFRDTRSSQG